MRQISKYCINVIKYCLTLEVVNKNVYCAVLISVYGIVTSSRGIDNFVSGRIKKLRVDLQSFDKNVLEESLSASFFIE